MNDKIWLVTGCENGKAKYVCGAFLTEEDAKRYYEWVLYPNRRDKYAVESFDWEGIRDENSVYDANIVFEKMKDDSIRILGVFKSWGDAGKFSDSLSKDRTIVLHWTEATSFDRVRTSDDHYGTYKGEEKE